MEFLNEIDREIAVVLVVVLIFVFWFGAFLFPNPETVPQASWSDVPVVYTVGNIQQGVSYPILGTNNEVCQHIRILDKGSRCFKVGVYTWNGTSLNNSPLIFSGWTSFIFSQGPIQENDLQKEYLL